jgi:signal transduction histidine kinase
MTNPFSNNKNLETTYHEFDIDLRVSQTRIGAILALILVPAGSSLEYFIYPQFLTDFFIIRILCDLVLLPIYLILFFPIGRQYVRWLSAAWAMAPVLSISAMIYFAEGSQSPYYAGLNLMIIVTCQLLPYTLKESIGYCLAVLLSYVLACLFHTAIPFDPNIFYNNVYFIILTSIISVTAGYYYNKRRIKDFSLNHELDLRNKQLEELDKMKSEFFANVSHELRTPLTLILAPIQQLLQSPVQLSDKIAELLRTAQDNGLRLLKLVNDMLEVIKLEEGKTKFYIEPIEINAFLAATISAMNYLTEPRKITLNKDLYDGVIVIDADSYALERMFLNILGNAAKFTPEGGSILVTSELLENNVVIEVADTGIGISPEALPDIFERFHQVDASSTRKYQGSGIGLALVKELVENMHGKISAESEPGVGTTIRITLPVSDKEYAREETDKMPIKSDLVEPLHRDAELVLPIEARDEQSDIKTIKSDEPVVLVVDDEPDMRRYLVNSLNDSYNVIQARDGKQGLEMAREYKPDLMLLDLMLPEIDGLEVCKRLKTDVDTRKIKIMLLTARIDETSKITALKNGADDFLTKPFSQLEVQTRLRNLYQTAKLEDNLRQQNIKLEKTLTELQKTQSSLIQSEKLNALGSLAAGLLHEVNNPLNYTLMALQTVLSDPDIKDNDELQETFADINEGMQRIQEIVTDLHTFAHPSEQDKQIVFSFNSALDSALRFTAHDRNNILIKRDITEEDKVIGSEGHIVQVLINLLSNAYQANEGLNGNRQGEILIQGERNQEKLHILFKDNGAGMNEEVLAHIFDPFYTTRDVGEGMGLGLSVSHTIIENHGSNLKARSKQDEWTEFSFDLPLSNQM